MPANLFPTPQRDSNGLIAGAFGGPRTGQAAMNFGATPFPGMPGSAGASSIAPPWWVGTTAYGRYGLHVPSSRLAGMEGMDTFQPSTGAQYASSAITGYPSAPAYTAPASRRISARSAGVPMAAPYMAPQAPTSYDPNADPAHQQAQEQFYASAAARETDPDKKAADEANEKQWQARAAFGPDTQRYGVYNALANGNGLMADLMPRSPGPFYSLQRQGLTDQNDLTAAKAIATNAQANTLIPSQANANNATASQRMAQANTLIPSQANANNAIAGLNKAKAANPSQFQAPQKPDYHADLMDRILKAYPGIDPDHLAAIMGGKPVPAAKVQAGSGVPSPAQITGATGPATGSGPPAAPSAGPVIGQTATNPTTGQKLTWDGSNWR